MSRGLTQNPERGSIALLLVLFTVALITAVNVETISMSQMTAKVVANRRDMEKAYQLAQAAVRWSFFRLELDRSLDQIPPIPGTNYGGKKDDLTEVQWAFPLSYPLPTELLGVANPSDLGAGIGENPTADAEELGGTFTTTLFDESAKINLNDVGSGGPPGNAKWSGTAEVLETLLLSPRFRKHLKNRDHREILWEIEDWVDVDSEVNHLNGGVEDVEYQTDDIHRTMKNGPFYSLEEVRQLKSIDDALFRELKPFVTVYPFNARLPRNRTQLVTPLGKINVNTAPLEVLAATLSTSVFSDPEARIRCAQQVVKYRDAVVFRSTTGANSYQTAIQTLCGLDESTAVFTLMVQRILDVRSDFFEIEATGMVSNIEKTIRSVVSRRDPKKIKILYWKVI